MIETLQYDPNVLTLDLGSERMSAKQQDVQAEALWHGIPIEGFNGPGEEMVRAAMSRVPPELLTNVHHIKAAPELQPKHGRFDIDTRTININPLIFNLRQRFGKGQGWIHHAELCMVHEIGHSIYSFLPEKEKDQWRDISGWMIGTQAGQAPAYKETRPGWPKSESAWTHATGVQFTRKYAKRNDDEDFADSFAFFILSKPHQMAPAKRAFITRLLEERVKAYPRVSIEGPHKPYGERDVAAYGTSEGVTKAWDTRGRGRHPKPSTGRPNTGSGRPLMSIMNDPNLNSDEKQEEIRKQGRQQGVPLRKEEPYQYKIKFPGFTYPTHESSSSDERQQHLSRAKVKVTTDNQEGGASISRVIIFEDGSKAVFKPASGEYGEDELLRREISWGLGTEREVATWEVAKLVGMDDLVAPTVEREFDGERGALIEFQKGDTSYSWDDERRYDGSKDSARAAVFDYVIGNEDRHGGNWLVEGDEDGDPEDLKLHLIDHNLTFPDLGDWSPVNNSILYHEQRLSGYRPMDLAKPYVDALPEIKDILDKLGLENSIPGVMKRINKLAKAQSFTKLVNP